MGAYLESEGLLVQDPENTYLQLQTSDGLAMNDLPGHSITYHIAVGPRPSRKALTLQTVPARDETKKHSQNGKDPGFSRHTGVAAKTCQRRKLERLSEGGGIAPHGSQSHS